MTNEQTPVVELIGARLDAAVAQAEGWETHGTVGVAEWMTEGHWCTREGGYVAKQDFKPSANWSVGGPLIERLQMTLWHRDEDGDSATVWHACVATYGRYEETEDGPTPLIAAMRAVVSRARALQCRKQNANV